MPKSTIQMSVSMLVLGLVIKGEKFVVHNICFETKDSELSLSASSGVGTSIELTHEELKEYMRLFPGASLQRVIVFYDSSDDKKEEHINQCLEVTRPIQKGSGLKLVTLVQFTTDSNSNEEQIDIQNVMGPDVIVDYDYIQSMQASSEDQAKNYLSKKALEIYQQLRSLEGAQNWRNVFQVSLNEITDKALNLRKRGHTKAADKADTLARNLSEYADAYSNKFTGEGYKIFNDNCLNAINDSKEELQKHRGWKQVLGNLVIAIACLGVFYPVALLGNKLITGNYLFFNQTDSAEKLKNVEKEINQSAPRPN